MEYKNNKCPICGQSYTGFGNNPDPLNFDRVCNDCNIKIVIPTRLLILKHRDKHDKMEN